jgi:HSP20 family molecular chaperone IbpA
MLNPFVEVYKQIAYPWSFLQKQDQTGHKMADPWEEYHQMMQRSTDVLNADTGSDKAAWDEYHRMQRRSRVHIPTPEEDEVHAWSEHHKMLRRAAELYDGKAGDDAQAWEENHRLHRRAKVVPKMHSDEWLAWQEHHRMMKRAMVASDKDIKAADHPMAFMRNPELHVIPKPETFVLVVDCPGVRKEDLNVDVVETAGGGKALMLTGERRFEDEHVPDRKDESPQYYSHTFFYGKFSRMVPLPPYVDARPETLKANYSNGSVRIMLPKAKPKHEKPAKTTSIPIA